MNRIPPDDLPEVTALVAHEFNNYLNGILLHVAILDQELPAARGELGVIRQQAQAAAGLVKRLQQFNQRVPLALGPVDLNAVVREVLARLPPDSAATVRPELADGLPPALADRATLERLVNLVVADAQAVAGPRTVTVRAQQAGAHVVVVVEDTGPAIADALLPRLFEPFVVSREGGDGIRLAVSKLLARRLQGAIRGRNRPEGGVAIEIELNGVSLS
jgi:signal transduction histidine kinase